MGCLRRVSTLCLLVVSVCSVLTTVSSATVETSRSAGSVSRISRRGVSKQSDERLIFPTDLETETGSLSNRGGDTDPLPCPDDALFCESAPDYPKDVIKKRLKKQPKLLLDILYEEACHNSSRSRRSLQSYCDRTKIFNELGEEVHNKFGPESGNEKELCNSTPKIVYPNKAKSKEGVFEFVVNDDEHRQGIRVETCVKMGGECNEIPTHILPLGYKSRCVQKNIVRTLVVLNRNSTSDVQGFVTKPFEFPSCCSCVLYDSMSVSGSNRFADDDETTPVVRNLPEKPRRKN